MSEPAITTTQEKIKCVVWDLDDTLWDGILLESPDVKVRRDVVEIIKTLDERGILHSIASKNDHEQALRRLEAEGLDHYFLYPQIGWGAKSTSIVTIAERLNIGLSAMAFVDDALYEREEVGHSVPQVLCLDIAACSSFLEMPELTPRFITADSRRRRLMYQSDMRRQDLESRFDGPQEDFLASLGMVLTLSEAAEDDLQRAEELTVRTHQLNTTGYTYSYEELNHLRCSDDHTLLVADLKDRYGPYGKVGLVLLEHKPDAWTIKLLLMSCRVMGRGVGTVLINHLRRSAAAAGVELLAEFKHTSVNRLMWMTYKFSHFSEIKKEDGDLVLLRNDSSASQAMPSYMTLVCA